MCGIVCFFFFKQKTAYEMRISDWSSDVCSSDLPARVFLAADRHGAEQVDLAHQRLGRRVAIELGGERREHQVGEQGAVEGGQQSDRHAGAEDRKSVV